MELANQIGTRQLKQGPKPAPLSHERYEHVESGHSGNTYNIHLLDPVFVNRNSIDTIVQVLRHIGTNAGLSRYSGSERKWLIICCDGSPFTLMVKICREFLLCLECNKNFMGSKEFLQHVEKSYSNHCTYEILHMREFDWIVLLPGDGHYEMNFMKAYFELNWNVFIQRLVISMGWRSEATQNSAKRCHDNHKTWQLLMVLYLGTLQELLLLYVRDCEATHQHPSAKDFLTRYCDLKSSESSMFRYMSEMICRYAQVLFNFRMGIRRNNSSLVQLARYMSKELFHGCNHPKYQEIEIFSSFMEKAAPDKINEFLAQNISVSKSGSPSAGQGYDFLLEEGNREVHQWIRRGVATDEVWQQVIRNKDGLSGIRKSIIKILGISEKHIPWNQLTWQMLSRIGGVLYVKVTF